MDLALRGPGPDGPPGDEVGQELRSDRVQELGPRGDAQRGQVHQQPAGQAQALVDREAPVQVRVVDEPLPAHRAARLLEVDAHHDQQVLTKGVRLREDLRSEEHTSELQSLAYLVCRLLLEKKKTT